MPYQLMPANEEAFRVFLHVRLDVETLSSGRVLDVKKSALTAVLIGLEVKDKRSVFEKVAVLMKHLIAEEMI